VPSQAAPCRFPSPRSKPGGAKAVERHSALAQVARNWQKKFRTTKLNRSRLKQSPHRDPHVEELTTNSCKPSGNSAQWPPTARPCPACSTAAAPDHDFVPFRSHQVRFARINCENSQQERRRTRSPLQNHPPVPDRLWAQGSAGTPRPGGICRAARTLRTEPLVAHRRPPRLTRLPRPSPKRSSAVAAMLARPDLGRSNFCERSHQSLGVVALMSEIHIRASHWSCVGPFALSARADSICTYAYMYVHTL
jgi:hypothetical protein